MPSISITNLHLLLLITKCDINNAKLIPIILACVANLACILTVQSTGVDGGILGSAAIWFLAWSICATL